jgi:uncharacterized glyoxalase superfamily protein PhnB
MKRPVVIGHSTVSPCLLVEDIEEELKFLKAVFAAEAGRPRQELQGTVWQVEVRLGNSLLMIGRGNRNTTPAGGMLYVWTEDVDATYRRALENGAILISGPTDQPSGVREAGFKDPQGNIWWIGRQTRKLSNREVEQRLTEQRRRRL